MKSIIYSLKVRPFKTVWGLLWAVPAFACLFMMCVFVSVIYLSIDDGLDVWRSNT